MLDYTNLQKAADDYFRDTLKACAKEYNSVENQEIDKATCDALVAAFFNVYKKYNKQEKQAKHAATPKPKKNPDDPKRGRNAFWFFSQENREAVQSKSTDPIAFGDLSKELGKMWKALGEEERKVYQKKADDDKLRYIKEKEDKQNAEHPIEAAAGAEATA